MQSFHFFPNIKNPRCQLIKDISSNMFKFQSLLSSCLNPFHPTNKSSFWGPQRSLDSEPDLNVPVKQLFFQKVFQFDFNLAPRCQITPLSTFQYFEKSAQGHLFWEILVKVKSLLRLNYL